MILLRATSLSPQTRAFARRLDTESGQTVCFVVDERTGKVDVGAYPKIGIDRAACRALDLYCPADFAWRCGDYGLYLARNRFPDERFYWLIEYDVRLIAPRASDFFDRFAASDADLIAGQYRCAEPWWYWTHTMVARGLPVWRCLFPVVRLSASGVDLLYERRRTLSRRLFRRANWPNDESFVATVLTREGRQCADLNDFGAVVYDDMTYTFDHPIDGDSINDTLSPVRVLHPVLFGDDLLRKNARMAAIRRGESIPVKVRRHLLGKINKWSSP